MIVHYDPPGSVVDYIHRVGRTARAGLHGKSLLILQPDEAMYADHLREHKIEMEFVRVEVSQGQVLSPRLYTHTYIHT